MVDRKANADPEPVCSKIRPLPVAQFGRPDIVSRRIEKLGSGNERDTLAASQNPISPVESKKGGAEKMKKNG